MCRRPASLLVLLLLSGTILPIAVPDARAQAVYKCRGPEGLTYQDKPCPPGTDLPVPYIPPAPDYVPPPVAPIADAPVAREREREPVRPPPPPPPTMYRCTDAVSGKSYVTATPTSNLRYVPFWTVAPAGITSGGSGGSVSADLPTSDRPSRSLMGAYTAVQDRCRPMPVSELCGYWKQREDEVYSQRKNAFNDTRPQLEQEEAGLREQRATYCR